MTPASQVEVQVDGQSSGVAFLATSTTGAELCVVGKLSLVLLEEGQAAIVARPEPPGIHAGGAAPAELDETAGGMLVVTGGRPLGGRVVLRRGTAVLAEVGFGPGLEPVAVMVTEPVASESEDDDAREDEWLVIEGVTSRDARRWCKLPQMKLVATWEPSSALRLGSRACFIDLSTWTVSFLLRGRFSLSAPAPRFVTVSVEDTFVSSVRARPQPDDEDDEVRTAVRDAAPPPARVVEQAPLDEQTRVIQIPLEIPPEALPESTTRRGVVPRRNARASRSGLRLGAHEPLVDQRSVPQQDAPRPAAAPLVQDEETTKIGALPLEAGPTSVTRAFAAIAPEDPAEATRSELLRRVQQGERLESLELRGAALAGIALPGATLSGLDLSGCDLRGADLAGTDLRAARLDRAQLDGCRLDGANLSGASLVGASLRSVSLLGASFLGSDLTDALIGVGYPDDAFAGAKVDGLVRD